MDRIDRDKQLEKFINRTSKFPPRDYTAGLNFSPKAKFDDLNQPKIEKCDKDRANRIPRYILIGYTSIITSFSP